MTYFCIYVDNFHNITNYQLSYQYDNWQTCCSEPSKDDIIYITYNELYQMVDLIIRLSFVENTMSKYNFLQFLVN